MRKSSPVTRDFETAVAWLVFFFGLSRIFNQPINNWTAVVYTRFLKTCGIFCNQVMCRYIQSELFEVGKKIDSMWIDFLFTKFLRKNISVATAIFFFFFVRINGRNSSNFLIFCAALSNSPENRLIRKAFGFFVYIDRYLQ